MFPTHVGMNRHVLRAKVEANHVPHTRGDEPEDRIYETNQN